MFKSFFPNPRMLVISAIAWSIVVVGSWYAFMSGAGGIIGLPPMADPESAPIGLGYFGTTDSIWFYTYFIGAMALFCLAWTFLAPELRWRNWSLWGSAFILFNIYFDVDISVALNRWRGPFYDMIVKALQNPNTVSESDLYWGIGDFFSLASVSIVITVINIYFTRHYLFRWRNAMNDYYYESWNQVRHIEGASQRIQEDTQRFARIVESLGERMISSIMTLIAFLPVLNMLSANITTLPIVGDIPYPLVTAAIFWSLFGTFLLIVVGVKLPGLEFHNQRVEAAFRKELVYGEDSDERADPISVRQLFDNVRKNYFRLYFHYLYFDVTRYVYLQTDVIFHIFLMVPSIAAGVITFGVYQQISSAFGQVTNSFQYLVNSWTTIIDLLSIHKRLRSFEAALAGEDLPKIEYTYQVD